MATKLVLLIGLMVALVSGVPLNENPIYHEISPHIVGGSEAPEKYALHMIALVFGQHLVNLMCGASLIGNSLALTAAHCIDGLVHSNGELIPTLQGVYGSNEWASTEKRARFTHYINHEGWDSWRIKNDIGVLFLADKIVFSERVAPISLDFDWADGGDKSYVTGWGRLWDWGPIPARLQLLYVETLSGARCLDGIKEAVGGLWAPPFDPTIEICTLHPKGYGFGMCNGDSGSALVSQDTGRQIGIVSWGFPCAIGAPDVFVRISGFKSWLQNILEN